MASLITGVHHIAIKCENTEMFEKVVSFYTETLGLPVIRKWGEGEGQGMMVSTGDSILELFASGMTVNTTGAVNHFALATNDVDACVAAAEKAGLEVTIRPTDIVIGSVPPFPARIAFVIGFAGEELEFFCER